jgi:hypothetical protein
MGPCTGLPLPCTRLPRPCLWESPPPAAPCTWATPRSSSRKLRRRPILGAIPVGPPVATTVLVKSSPSVQRHLVLSKNNDVSPLVRCIIDPLSSLPMSLSTISTTVTCSDQFGMKLSTVCTWALTEPSSELLPSNSLNSWSDSMPPDPFQSESTKLTGSMAMQSAGKLQQSAGTGTTQSERREMCVCGGP